MGWDVAFISAFGIAFIITMLALAIKYPHPTNFQLLVFRTTLGLSAGGIAAAIPGFLNLSLDFPGAVVRAGGALAVFLLIYRINPAHLIIGSTDADVERTPVGPTNLGESTSDPGNHHGLMYYEDGDEEDIKRWDFVSPPPLIGVDRTAEYKMRKNQPAGVLEIARIAVRTEDCRWFKMSDLSSRDGIHMAEDFKIEEMARFYDLPKYYFHQMKPSSSQSNKLTDPVLDIIAINNSLRTVIIKGLSVAALAAWSIPKAVSVPQIIRPMAAYIVAVDFRKRFSSLVFNEPLFLEQKGIWRFIVRLDGFRTSVRAFGNEALISIRIEENASFTESEPLYLGILS